MSEEAKEMRDELNFIIGNKRQGSNGQRPIQAYVFMFDASDRYSFQRLLKIIS